MKKRNTYILYSIVLGLLSICSFACELSVRDFQTRLIFLLAGCVTLFLFAICAKTAHQTFYYNKAIDAWNNWNEEMQKQGEVHIKQKEEVFEEFGFDYED